MNPERRTTISGHLVEEFRWLDCPMCYVDAHRVSDSFDHAVADLQATSRVLSANRSKNTNRPFDCYTESA
jgi:hypothetical protein